MYIFANFKDYLDAKQTQVLVGQLLDASWAVSSMHSVVVFPSLIALADVVHTCQDTRISVGVQHTSDGMSPARTGDVSPEHAKASGASYALIGHSEQRHISGETDTMVALQFSAAISVGLIPVLCVGETRAELAEGRAETRIAEQLKVLHNLEANTTCFIAYEPVWAIQGSGSGEVCLPADVARMHAFIHEQIGLYAGRSLPILFGGSVNSENVVSYTSLPYVDGVLIGSAATRIESFEALVNAVNG